MADRLRRVSMGASTAELIIGGLGAAASTAAVLTALWIALRADAVRARRHAPVLDLELVRGVMEVRLAVRNARDKTTARDVEVLVINVEHHPIHAVRQHPKMDRPPSKP